LWCVLRERNQSIDYGPRCTVFDVSKDMEAPVVSVVVSSSNGVNSLQRCLDGALCWSLERQELLVVDGGATDETWTILKS
jgi:hypothetical protein